MKPKLSLQVNSRKMEDRWSEVLLNFGINVCESRVHPLQLAYVLIELDSLEILTLMLCFIILKIYIKKQMFTFTIKVQEIVRGKP